ncbi:uncharacterized protein FIESC28_00254 [Fusarium coffeatum]|uniref:Uncharacterized protein n=1 Tax=Fusarium coffeatum TaxID=231269 RepID=A0A366SEA0_9HYPO|nr:uncharacterized protein FIESC28_00254 [Fusarium coffeatum]RBR26986.1 hypothetical protein FIESC28_00254 [Fusarium coffeatum]
MDWADDNAICCQNEASKVFRYQERPTSVIRVVPGLVKPLVWTMNSEEDWDNWFRTEHPKLNGKHSGFVIILARRDGEPKLDPVKRKESNDWIKDIKQVTPNDSHPDSLRGTGGQRTLRNLPFSEKVFKRIAHEFHIHNSIIRVVSRADVSDFSAMNLEMGQHNGQSLPAHVYNIRTSNAWDRDLAATTTYFPSCNLSFSIMFGCTLSVEAEILTRLGRTTYETYHPLLVPSLIVELERKRHLPIVEDTIDQVETRILELDQDPESLERIKEREKVALKEAKRSAWLDMLYLRNQLLSWRSCLEALDKQTRYLNRRITQRPFPRFSFRYEGTDGFSVVDDNSSEYSSDFDDSLEIRPVDCVPELAAEELDSTQLVVADFEPSYQESRGAFTDSESHIRRTGTKIRGRLQEIKKDYNEKIQECTSGIEGMVMSTQWAQGETNVEIALATSQDSRHMRSIALVTMVFLPGTFFASVFSMGFFDFKDSRGSVIVSQLFWLYVVLAAGFTGLTVGAWYYLGVYRYKKHRSLASGLKRSYCSNLRVFDLLRPRKTE